MSLVRKARTDRIGVHLLLVACVAVAAVSCVGCRRHRLWATLSTNCAATVHIYAVQENTLETEQVSLYYEVRVPPDSRSQLQPFGVVRALRDIDGLPEGGQFDLLGSKNGDLVAVVERTHPETVVILHQLSTGFSWPGTGNRVPDWKEYRENARALVQQLNCDCPSLELRLGRSLTRVKGDLGGSRGSRVSP